MARLPYTNFHDLNLDWVLKVIKKAFTPDNPPPYPVKSVNGKTGNVTLTGGDIPFSEDFQQATVLDFCDYAIEAIDNLNVDVASKQDAPILVGSPGQVLGLDADQTPVWLNNPSPESIIDDNAGLGDTTKVYSADHVTGLISPIIDDLDDINGDIDNLKNKIKSSIHGRITPDYLTDFTQAAMYNGEIQSYGAYRITSDSILTIPAGSTMTIATGFQVQTAFFVGGNYSATYTLSADYTFPATSYIRISIKRVTENTSETADITEFANAVTFPTDIQNQISVLSSSLTSSVNTINTNIGKVVQSYGQISASNIGTLGWTSVKDFPSNRVFGLGNDLTNAMITDLPSYGGYAQLTKTTGVYPTVYISYEYINASGEKFYAWQTNNNTTLSPWKKVISGSELFRTISARSKITSSSKVIFIGDSLVSGVGGTGWQQDTGRYLLTYNGADLYANDTGTCWANMMRDYLVTNYGCTAYNNGLSGFNSINIPQNIASLVPSDTTHVIACWGINDRSLNYDTVAGYQTVIDYCNSIGAEIIPITICPCLQPNNTYTITQYDIVSRIKKVCEDNNFECCDLFGAINYYFYVKGITFDTNYLPDNLHPNDVMYTIMYNVVRQLLGV